MTRILVPFALPVIISPWACSSGDGGETGGNGDVVFRADVSALPGVSKDTGLQPEGSPVQLQLKVSARGEGTVEATARASGSSNAPVLNAIPGSGKVTMDGGFALEGRLVADVSGLPSYDGEIPGLDNVNIPFQATQTFDPWLLTETAVAEAPIPATDLPSIPLPGGLPGSLIIKVAEGSTVNLEFHGACAAISGNEASYTGQVARSGSLILEPRIELEVPIVGTKTFEIPSLTVPIGLPAEDVDLGTKTVTFANASSGEAAVVGACGGGDGGAGGGAGTGGSGGAGEGGTGGGGTSGGGTGGAADGGIDGSAGGTDGGDLCQSCAESACASDMNTCRNNAECLALWDCWNACTTTACSQECLLAHPSVQDPFLGLQGCFTAKCHDTCGWPSCLLGTGDATCDSCLGNTCSAECEVASDSEGCMTWLQCNAYCADIECDVDCNSFPSAGCQPLSDCLSTSCASQCGG